MGRNSKIAIAAILALAIASCSSQGDQSNNPTPTPTNTPATNTPATNTPTANTPAAPKQAANQPFNNPVVAAKQTPPVITTTGNLIQPTNATERVGIVSKGRNDPFAQIVEPYSNGVTNTPAVAKPVPKLPRLPAAKGTSPLARKRQIRSKVIAATKRNLLNQQKHRINKTAIAQRAVPKAIGQRTAPVRAIAQRAVPKAIASVKVNPNRGFNRVLPKVLPQVIPNPGLASVIPPPPQPELARAVLVSGVVLLGREPQAIIKVPTEPTSRYVQAGQRLANGVLIKRIEMNEGSEPIVILEQYGIEVARMVGEAPATQTPPTAASGGNPVSLTVPPQNPVPGGAI